MQGLLAAAAAALLVALSAHASGFFTLIGWPAERAVWAMLILLVAGLAGTLFDSLLGATLEGRVAGVEKGAVNFACTLAGALVAAGWAWLLL